MLPNEPRRSNSSMSISGPSRILSYLFLGSKSDAKDKSGLLRNKIKFVLNCTPKRSDDPENGCPNYFEKEKTFVYKRIPIFDNRGEDMAAHIDFAIQFIEQSRHHGNILVHCHKGISRSSSFIIAYLIKVESFTFDEALSFIQSCRPQVSPNEAFITQLIHYESTLQRQSIEANTIESKKEDKEERASQIGPRPYQEISVVAEEEQSLKRRKIDHEKLDDLEIKTE